MSNPNLDNFIVLNTVSKHTKLYPVINIALDQIFQALSAKRKSNNLNSFTLFPKLPTELRIKIWKLSFTPQRVAVNKDGRIQQDQTINAPLSVNSEARDIFLENYSRCFHGLDQQTIYLNASNDIVCINLHYKVFGP